MWHTCVPRSLPTWLGRKRLSPRRSQNRSQRRANETCCGSNIICTHSVCPVVPVTGHIMCEHVTSRYHIVILFAQTLCATLRVSYMDGPCHMWVSHVTLSHHHIVCTHSVCDVAPACHTWMDSVTVEHYLHALHVPRCAFHIWMGKSRAGESRHVITSSYYLHELCVPRHIWMGDVTCGWVTSRYRVII